ncbi:MAG TPA: phosphoribosyltransferase family protein [Pyrinomonadaceae bacterium]|nr:phosphoribosyltransferase family protein [Pyrinomonadaceae bacterium]
MTTFRLDDEPGRTRQDARAGLRAERFLDAREAGRELASELEAYAGRADSVVLAIASGGVPVGSEVAARLGAPLDVVLMRRLFTPRGPDEPVCAFSVGGTLLLDEEIPPRAASPSSGTDFFVAEALDELARRERECRGVRPPIELARKTLILVDNGVRTGSTMLAAIRAVRAVSKPARIVAAAPVASPESVEAVVAAAEEFVCLALPQPFGHVGVWYANFERPDDARIRETLERAAGRG